MDSEISVYETHLDNKLQSSALNQIESSIINLNHSIPVDINVTLTNISENSMISNSVTANGNINNSSTSTIPLQIKCEKCGKEYKHRNCLLKHRWEHHPTWESTKKACQTKHQQVQLLEAAQILTKIGNDDDNFIVMEVSDSLIMDKTKRLSTGNLMLVDDDDDNHNNNSEGKNNIKNKITSTRKKRGSTSL